MKPTGTVRTGTTPTIPFLPPHPPMFKEKETKKEQCSPEPEEDPHPSFLARSSSPVSVAPSSLFDALSTPSSPYTAPSSPLPVPDEKPQPPRGTKRGSESSEDTDASSATEEPPAKKLKSEHDDDPRPSGHLKIKRHSPKARVPTRGSALAAGYDLYRLDAGVFKRSGDPGLMVKSARKRKPSRPKGKLSSIPKFRL